MTTIQKCEVSVCKEIGYWALGYPDGQRDGLGQYFRCQNEAVRTITDAPRVVVHSCQEHARFAEYYCHEFMAYGSWASEPRTAPSGEFGESLVIQIVKT
jgi:hypothetical protein